jgi:hypothetical protein
MGRGWQLSPAVRLRTQGHYDCHVGPGELFDNFTKDHELTGLLDLFFLF